MKKLAGLFLAATLVFGMTTVAFGADSKSTTVTPGTTPEGAEISREVATTGETAIAAGIEKTSDGKVTISEEKKEEVKKDLKADKLQILDVFDVKAPAGHKDGEAVDITMKGVTWQEGIKVLHFQDGKWVALPTKKGPDNTVVATFTKFSPTAIAIVSTTATGSTTGSTADKNTGKSPKTGESDFVVYVALLAVVAGASAFAAKRKFA